MNKMPFLLAAILLSIIAITYLLYQKANVQTQLNEAQAIQKQLNQKFDSMQLHADSLVSVLKQKDTLLSKCEQRANILLDEWDIKSLKRQGLNAPVNDLKEDLIGSKELIQEKGVHGGEMQFYSKDNIFILNHQWALAYYEDGHNAGAMLLEFHVTRDGGIQWEVIRSSLR